MVVLIRQLQALTATGSAEQPSTPDTHDPIMYLSDQVNAAHDYFTTSSCSGTEAVAGPQDLAVLDRHCWGQAGLSCCQQQATLLWSWLSPWKSPGQGWAARHATAPTARRTASQSCRPYIRARAQVLACQLRKDCDLPWASLPAKFGMRSRSKAASPRSCQFPKLRDCWAGRRSVAVQVPVLQHPG